LDVVLTVQTELVGLIWLLKRCPATWTEVWSFYIDLRNWLDLRVSISIDLRFRSLFIATLLPEALKQVEEW